MILIYFIGYFTLATQIHYFQSNATLIGTHIIYRHGDRSPTMLYPTSTTNPNFWPNGLGQLTSRGQLQQIRLGQYLRRRYSNLLNDTYVASEITVRSTDYDRTLMSAYSNLVGLYPTSERNLDLIMSKLVDNDGDIWPDALPWQPIPVHTVSRSLDYIMGVSDCPRFLELLEDLANSEKVKKLMVEFQEFFKQLELWTGSHIEYFTDALAIADTVLTEALYSINPLWANATILAQLRHILDLSYFELFDSLEMNRIHVGPIVRDIMENIEKLITQKSDRRKAKIYSGHDAIIVALLSFFGTRTNQPPYCSTLFFDLYHIPENNTYGIKLEFLNSTNERIIQPIPLPPCSNDICPITVLAEWLQDRLPSSDMTKECISKRSDGSLSARCPCSILLLFLLAGHILNFMP